MDPKDSNKNCWTTSGNKEVNGRDARRGKNPGLQRSRRKEFEEDKYYVKGRKMSVDLAKRNVVRQPTPDHKTSIGSEFS